MIESFKQETVDNTTTDKIKMVTGAWLFCGNCKDYYGDICSVYRCSNCSEKVMKRSNFCPNCGSEMKGWAK